MTDVSTLIERVTNDVISAVLARTNVGNRNADDTPTLRCNITEAQEAVAKILGEAITRASSTDTEDGAELEAGHEYLLLASYCGNDNDDCSDSCPCSDCLAMCNIFDANGKFLRELGSNQEMHK
jgi:hypothetical protein